MNESEMLSFSAKQISLGKKVKSQIAHKWISKVFVVFSVYGFLFTDDLSGCNKIIHLLLFFSGITYLFTLCFKYSTKFIYIFAYWFRLLFLFAICDIVFMLANIKEVIQIYNTSIENRFKTFFSIFGFMFTFARISFLYIVFARNSKISTKILKRAVKNNERLKISSSTSVSPSKSREQK